MMDQAEEVMYAKLNELNKKISTLALRLRVGVGNEFQCRLAVQVMSTALHLYACTALARVE